MKNNGGLAQLARAPALQAGGHRFDSDILHLEFPNGKFLLEIDNRRMGLITGSIPVLTTSFSKLGPAKDLVRRRKVL